MSAFGIVCLGPNAPCRLQVSQDNQEAWHSLNCIPYGFFPFKESLGNTSWAEHYKMQSEPYGMDSIYTKRRDTNHDMFSGHPPFPKETKAIYLALYKYNPSTLSSTTPQIYPKSQPPRGNQHLIPQERTLRKWPPYPMIPARNTKDRTFNLNPTLAKDPIAKIKLPKQEISQIPNSFNSPPKNNLGQPCKPL